MNRRRSSGEDGLMGLFEESGRNVERTGTLLKELLTEYPERSALARDILICEQEGDRITHDIIHRLSSNGTKLERGDAYELARALDDVVDYAEETADSARALLGRGPDGAGRGAGRRAGRCRRRRERRALAAAPG